MPLVPKQLHIVKYSYKTNVLLLPVVEVDDICCSFSLFQRVVNKAKTLMK